MRSYAALDLELRDGLVLVTGRNGAGKTNLLEALHLGTQGFSPRTRSDAQIVRHGSELARIELRGARGAVETDLQLLISIRDGKKARLNGAALRSAEALRQATAALVFTPDRLVVVKGGPAARRAYFDRSLPRLLPSRSTLPADYAAALGQRNAALRRVAAGASSRDALAPWTDAVAATGADLARARGETIDLLARPARECAEELGLPDLLLEYDGDPPTVELLERRLDQDLERGSTGAGPHLHDVSIRSGRRELRSFGSQGEQRLAVLALVLAEAEVIASRSGIAPLVLLDDVLSELDTGRRESLGSRLARTGQTVVTATGADALPLDPQQLLVVTPGRVAEAA